MDEFKLQGRTIYKAPHVTKHDDGSSSFTLGFPVCEVSEWVKEPEQVLGMLNSYDELHAQLAERDKTIERLRALVQCLIDNDPNADAADAVTVLDVWRKEAKAVLGRKAG